MAIKRTKNRFEFRNWSRKQREQFQNGSTQTLNDQKIDTLRAKLKHLQQQQQQQLQQQKQHW